MRKIGLEDNIKLMGMKFSKEEKVEIENIKNEFKLSYHLAIKLFIERYE